MGCTALTVTAGEVIKPDAILNDLGFAYSSPFGTSVEGVFSDPCETTQLDMKDRKMAVHVDFNIMNVDAIPDSKVWLYGAVSHPLGSFEVMQSFVVYGDGGVTKDLVMFDRSGNTHLFSEAGEGLLEFDYFYIGYEDSEGLLQLVTGGLKAGNYGI